MKDLLFFIKLFRPYQGWMLSASIVALITSLSSIALLSLSGWFITAAAVAGSMAPDGVAISFNFLQPAAEIRALAIIRTVGRYAERLLSHEATFRVLAEIRAWFFKKLIPLAPGRLSMKRSADVLHSLIQDIDSLDALYLRICSPFFVAFFGSVFMLMFIGYHAFYLSLMLAWVLVVVGLLIPWVFNRLGSESAENLVEQTAMYKTQQLELLQGMAELKAFNALDRYQKFLSERSEQLLAIQQKNQRLMAASTAIITCLSQLSFLLSVLYSALLFQQGQLSAANMVMLVFCVFAVFELVTPLAPAMQMLGKTQRAAKRIRAYAELKPTVKQPVEGKKTADIADIQLHKLNFFYPGQTEWLLEDISLTIPHGHRIAIIGESGAGKSTFLHLLLRYFDPQAGRVELAGIDIRKLDADFLMQQFSVLSQETELFAGTLKQNLLLAKPSASRFELLQAIQSAGLKTFIKQLPKGLDSWIGEKGATVSGGQARRIALARVYLKNAPVLLLDEPTEGLDRETEEQVLNALNQLAENKTLIMVTHRTTGLRLVDQVFEIKQGKLIKAD